MYVRDTVPIIITTNDFSSTIRCQDTQAKTSETHFHFKCVLTSSFRGFVRPSVRSEVLVGDATLYNMEIKMSRFSR